MGFNIIQHVSVYRGFQLRSLAPPFHNHICVDMTWHDPDEHGVANRSDCFVPATTTDCSLRTRLRIRSVTVWQRRAAERYCQLLFTVTDCQSVWSPVSIQTQLKRLCLNGNRAWLAISIRTPLRYTPPPLSSSSSSSSNSSSAITCCSFLHQCHAATRYFKLQTIRLNAASNYAKLSTSINFCKYYYYRCTKLPTDAPSTFNIGYRPFNRPISWCKFAISNKTWLIVMKKRINSRLTVASYCFISERLKIITLMCCQILHLSLECLTYLFITLLVRCRNWMWKRELMQQVKRRKLTYYGHISRKMNCLEKDLIEGCTPG